LSDFELILMWHFIETDTVLNKKEIVWQDPGASHRTKGSSISAAKAGREGTRHP
jgi:hypothetical protein